LKPSNILVCLYDGDPVPKVIDFGLAKAIHQPLRECLRSLLFSRSQALNEAATAQAAELACQPLKNSVANTDTLSQI
jgi:serine/threonine protein kinase